MYGTGKHTPGYTLLLDPAAPAEVSAFSWPQFPETCSKTKTLFIRPEFPSPQFPSPEHDMKNTCAILKVLQIENREDNP